jgi:hypothetical protein
VVERGSRDVGTIIRAKLAAGTLPTARPSQIWVGENSGDGRMCDACEEAIEGGEMEYEAHVIGPGVFHFHRHCFDVWQQERARRLSAD